MKEDSTSRKDMFLFAKNLAKQAGEYAYEKQRSVEVRHKNDDVRDLVTNVDFEIDEMLQKAILEKYPDHSIHSEESKGIKQGTEFLWALDPIDGTSNYSRGIPHYATAVSVMKDNEVIVGAVYNPTTDECFAVDPEGNATLNGEPIRVSKVTKLKKAGVNFHPGRKEEHREWAGKLKVFLLGAAQKSSNFCASALDVCFVAAGRTDVLIYGTFTAIDVIGSLQILRAAGGEIYDYETRKPLTELETPKRIIATSTPELLGDFFTQC
jgi:myo-inositol-1(or 4)-monophosphatase